MKFEALVVSIDKLLSPKRMKYAGFISWAFWIGWIVTIALGNGTTDMYGNLIGNDFSGFYSAGKIILMGRSSDLYNIDLTRSIQEALRGDASKGFNIFMNPPHYALLMVPFALLPYPWAPLLWIGAGLGCLWLSMKWLAAEHPSRSFLWALTWFPVFCAAGFGQNSFFSLAIFSLTYSLWMRKKNLLSGLMFSLMLFKPQFLIGICLLWILDWRRSWKALLGLVIGLCIQIGINFGFLPEASLSYVDYMMNTIPGMVRVEGSAIWNAYATLSFWQTLLPNFPGLAQTFYLISLGFGLFYYLKFFMKFFTEKPIIYSATIVWTIWSIPYLNVYDWSLLLIPAVLLWHHAPASRSIWKLIYSFIWVITLISSEFTSYQLERMSFAVQLSIPAFLIVIVIAYRVLMGYTFAKNPIGLPLSSD